MKKTKAFTLAEVLITLGVIGVVAMLTLPNLISNHNKKLWAASLKKAYSTASQSCNLILAKNEVNDISNTDFFYALINKNDFENIAKNYFSNAKIEKISSKPTEYNNIGDSGYLDWNKYLVEFPDFTFFMDGVSTDPIYVHGSFMGGSYKRNISYLVDVNGIKKGPNTLGFDIFQFTLQNNCSINISGNSSSYCNNTSHVQKANGCFAKIMQDGWEIKYDLKK